MARLYACRSFQEFSFAQQNYDLIRQLLSPSWAPARERKNENKSQKMPESFFQTILK